MAPAGTMAVICASDSTSKTAGMPLNVTEVAPAKPPPVRVTAVPTGARSRREASVPVGAVRKT